MAVTEGDILELEAHLARARRDLAYIESLPAAQVDGRVIALVEGLNRSMEYADAAIEFMRMPPATDESQIDWTLPAKMDKALRDLNELHEAVKNMKNYQGINAN